MESVVVLDKSQTAIQTCDESKSKAIDLAYRVMMSMHEWTWTSHEAALMANYVLWAHQRLSAIDQCVNGELEHHNE